MTVAGDVMTALEWPRNDAAAALGALARAAGFVVSMTDAAAPSDLGETICAAAEASGLDAEGIDVPADDPLRLVRRATPLLVHVPGHAGVLAILRMRGDIATLLSPSGRVEIGSASLEEALGGAVGRETAAVVAAALAGVSGIPPARRQATTRLLMAPTLADRPAADGWVIRQRSMGIKQDLRDARIYRRMAGVVAGYLLQFGLFVAIWREVGARSVSSASSPGVADGGGVGWAWFFGLLAAWVLVQLWASLAVSRLALDAGAVVRAGLLRGALRLDGEKIRSAGVGQLLGRALEADALDVLALGGGVEAVMGLFELVVGAAVLALGVAPVWSTAALLLAVATVFGLRGVHARRLRTWNENRRGMTHELVERMVGHRTVLIQDRPADRARADQVDLKRYDGTTRTLDAAEVWLSVLVPRAWLLAGLLVLAPAALRGGAALGAQLALSVGGVWLTYGALRRLGVALPALAQAQEAWRQIAPLVQETRVSDSALPGDPRGGDATANQAPLLVADHVSYQYPGRSFQALRDVSCDVATGDRVLIEGPSGGGKSTLAALLTGLKAPTGGALRLHGQNQADTGLGRWRSTVGGAPQFHDNHVFGASLLFNLMMGRRWPPRQEDLVAAEKVCRDLGLGGLIERMPSGLQQQVGETGWQLSHGERSRLFIARSLLQELEARVLDESFAALDPRTLDQVMAAVLERPEALIVIAHP